MAVPKRKNVDSVAPHYYDETNDNYVPASSSTPVPITVISGTDYAIRLDEASTTITYIGEAAAGSSSASAVWKVKRLTDSSGDITIEFADGNANYDNVWDNRASLSYS